MDSDLHLPWDNKALQELLLKVIQTGETTKVDFKRQLNFSTAEHHAELLKDISALANTYAHAYQNHGFIVLGVTGNTLHHTTFEVTADALQARIDDLLNKYVEPFISTQVRIFGEGQNTWGVIVVPPTGTAPHVFVKDLQKRTPGEIFVRRNTTTSKALPSDYSRFFRLHLDEHSYELRQQIDDLRRKFIELEKRVAEQKVAEGPVTPKVSQVVAVTPSLEPLPDDPTVTSDLLRMIEGALAKAEDPIVRALLAEAQKVHKFLSDNSIPWRINTVDKESGTNILAEMETASQTLWEALGALVLRDKAGKYDDGIVRALSILAHKYEAPSGVTFTDWGTYVRHYPLVGALYTVFIAGALGKRFALLKRIKELTLTRRSHYDQPIAVAYALFHVRRADEIFQTQQPNYPKTRWCDAAGMQIEKALKNTLKIEDSFVDWREAFFIGEFILALTPLDILVPETGKPALSHPSAGLYLYYGEAEPILKRFLSKEAGALAKVFTRPLKDILKEFDAGASKLGSGGCFTEGFASGASEAAFPEAKTPLITSQ